MLQQGQAERDRNPNTRSAPCAEIGGPEFLGGDVAGGGAGMSFMLSLHPIGPRYDYFSGSGFCEEKTKTKTKKL